MTNWFTDIVGGAADMLESGYNAVDTYFDDVLPNVTDGTFSDAAGSVGDLIFGDKGFFSQGGSSEGGGAGSGSSRFNIADTILRESGSNSPRGGRPSREGDTRPLESEDSRAVTARWLALTDRVGQVTGRTSI